MRRRPEGPRPGCPARYHDDLAAYLRHRCRCPAAGLAQSEYRRARNLGIAAPRRVPSLATTRRLRALLHHGHAPVQLAAALGTSPQNINYLLNGRSPTVMRTFADRVTRATPDLLRRPGTSDRARARARAAGWAPLRAWDGEVFALDDPDADDALAAETAGLAPSLRRIVIADRAEEALRAAERHDALSRAGRSRWTQNGPPAPGSAAARPENAPTAPPDPRKDVA